ncbi:MAG: ProQ/FINO family protein, partial [Janthinobacterium lividum]
PAKKVPPAPSAPTPQPAPAVAAPPERTPEEKAERARLQAERDRQAHLEAVQRRQRRVREALAEFRRRWPAVFTTPVPLAIGADKLIRAELSEMTTMRLKEVLGPWTHSTAYLRAVAAGVERINLDGSPGGVPDEEQREHAVEELRKRGKWPAEGAQRAAEPPVPAELPGDDPA